MVNKNVKEEITHKGLIPALKNFWNQFKTYRPAYAGSIIMLIAIIIGLFAQFITPYDPYDLEFELLQTPSLAHPMGTDYLGRDIFSRSIYGLSNSLKVGLGAAGLAIVIGVILGSIPGYYGGIIDTLFSRFFEIFMMIPSFLLVILIVALFGSNINFIIIVIGVTIWPSTARIMRSQVMTIKTREYVESSIVIGGSDLYTLFRHIIPNGIYPAITIGMLRIGSAILTEAGLSFLGLGDPSAISLGKDIRNATKFIHIAPHLITFPGLILIVIVLAVNMIGDGLNVTFNPRLRKR
jgi:peptide/nickel transport system permease protein